MKDISGQPSSISSASADLTRLLGNRLHQRLGLGGSMLYKETWKQKTTPAGLPYLEHTASVRRISDNAFIGLPTPKARDHHTEGEGKFSHSLAFVAEKKMGWPTPSATKNTKNSKDPQRMKENGVQTSLADAAWIAAGWPTTRANDAEKRGFVADDPRNGLVTSANLSGWPTTTTRDHKDGASDGTVPNNGLLGRVVWSAKNSAARLTASGQILTGSSAGMESGGQLNPSLARWLMGLPIGWDICALSVDTRSIRSSKKVKTEL